MSKRITTTDIKKWLSDWNKVHTDCKMTYTANLGYVGIGFLLEHGAIHTIAQGSSAREAWEKWCCWRDGYLYVKERI